MSAVLSLEEAVRCGLQIAAVPVLAGSVAGVVTTAVPHPL